MNKNTLASVIIPVYNLAEYIGDCLESIINQTYSNYEVIVVDDGSTDKSADIIKRFIERDSRIKYIYQENAGVSVARNNGISQSTGDYLVFVDGDDRIEATMLGKFVEIFQQSDCDIVKCGFTFYAESSNRKRESATHSHLKFVSGSDALRLLLRGKGISVCVWGGGYKKSLFDKNNIQFQPGMKIGEDGYCSMQLFAAAKKVCIIPENLYNVTVRSGSATRNNILPLGTGSVIDVFFSNSDLRSEYMHEIDAYHLRSISSNLLKNAQNLSFSDYNGYYHEVMNNTDYRVLNTSENRRLLSQQNKIKCIICSTSITSWLPMFLLRIFGLKILY